MRDFIRLGALLLLLACTKKTDDQKKPPPEPAKDAAMAGSEGSAGSAVVAKPAETPRPTLPKFDLAGRFETIGTAFNESQAFAAEKGNDAAKTRCAGLEPHLHPFCYEGIASSYFTK